MLEVETNTTNRALSMAAHFTNQSTQAYGTKAGPAAVDSISAKEWLIRSHNARHWALVLIV
jgi:hypothetical protein